MAAGKKPIVPKLLSTEEERMHREDWACNASVTLEYVFISDGRCYHTTGKDGWYYTTGKDGWYYSTSKDSSIGKENAGCC